MAIEQTKAPGNDIRSPANKTATSAARNKAAGTQDAKSGAGFAAVLASTDAVPEPLAADAVTTSGGALGTSDAMVDEKKPLQPARAPAAQHPDKTSHAEKKSEAGNSQKRTGKSSSTDLEAGKATGAATGEQQVLPAQLQALLPLPAEGAVALQPGIDGVSDQAVLAPVAGSGRGYMKTSQLQQALSAATDKGAGNRNLATGAARALAVPDANEGSPGSAALPSATTDLRQAAIGRASSLSETVLDSGAKMMSLMASVTAQAEHGGSERRGQEDVRGVGGAVSDTWTAEPVDTAGQTTGGFGTEDGPVQETVRYWVGGDAKQQAELTVNDVGGGSVDVTIHMQGKEAQVSFRADEQQARDALQAASSQLKQMLGQEGLTLSGLSVGTSSTGQDGGQQNPRPGVGPGKTTKVAAVGTDPALAPAGANTRASALAGHGRSLDLFV